ncbi:hypothetical protein PFISCL1PPCAC_10522, partial [Pristionchus fissidentatus]
SSFPFTQSFEREGGSLPPSPLSCRFPVRTRREMSESRNDVLYLTGGNLYSIETISRLSSPLSSQLNGSCIIDSRRSLSLCDVFVRNIDGDATLARLDSIITIMVHIQFGVDGSEFRSVASQGESTIGIRLSTVHQIIEVGSCVFVVQLHFDIAGWFVIAHENSANSSRLSDTKGRNEERKEGKEKETHLK